MPAFAKKALSLSHRRLLRNYSRPGNTLELFATLLLGVSHKHRGRPAHHLDLSLRPRRVFARPHPLVVSLMEYRASILASPHPPPP